MQVVQVTTTAGVDEAIRAAGGRLYVWPMSSVGCQPMVRLEAATERPRGRAFRRVANANFDLYLATAGRWPEELGLTLVRGRVRALWDGAVWQI